jgi:hypothetical protein
VAQDARQGEHRLAALRVVCAHAAEPEAVRLGSVVNRQAIFLDEVLALAGGEIEGVAVPLKVPEQPGAVLVLPLAGVHGGAPEADDHRQVLDAHRTLKLAGAAGGALKWRDGERAAESGPHLLAGPQPQCQFLQLASKVQWKIGIEKSSVSPPGCFG